MWFRMFNTTRIVRVAVLTSSLPFFRMMLCNERFETNGKATQAVLEAGSMSASMKLMT